MVKYVSIGVLGVVIGAFSYCGQDTNKGIGLLWGGRAIEESAQDSEVQQALQEDAQLAQTMPLKHFARHMKKRQPYYRPYTPLTYQDEYVSFTIDSDRVRIETPKGKVKFKCTEAVGR